MGEGSCCNTYCQMRLFNCLPHVAILILSVFLFYKHDYTIGKVIYNETSEWGTNAVIDLRALYYYTTYSQGVESDGYSNIKGVFSGTDPYYPSSSNYKIEGLPLRTDLVNFNDSYFQAQRANYNYHDIVSMRTKTANCLSYCGYKTNSEKYYCNTESTQCPVNGLLFVSKTYGKDSGNYTSLYKNYSNVWDFQLYNNLNSNPLVSFHISMVQPCGDITSQYIKRNVSINLMSEVDQCLFSKDSRDEHEWYYDSGFRHKEQYVYRQNSILGSITSWASSVNTEAMLLNTYKIYFKSYAQWNTKCANEYPTSDLAPKVKPYNDYMYKTLLANMIVAAILFTFDVPVFLLQVCCCMTFDKAQCGCCVATFHYIMIVMKSLLLIPLIVCASMQVHALVQIDQKFLDYAVANNCSEDMLQYAIQQFSNNRSYYLGLHGLLLAFIIEQIITLVYHAIYAANENVRRIVKRCIRCRCNMCRKRSTTAYDEILKTVTYGKDDIVQQYSLKNKNNPSGEEIISEFHAAYKPSYLENPDLNGPKIDSLNNESCEVPDEKEFSDQI